MIVGQSNVSLKSLERHAHSAKEFIEFSDSLVPEEFRHISAFTSNQRYLNCLLLRKSQLVPWDRKKEIISEVMKGLSIIGYTDTVIEVGWLYSVVDFNKVEKYLKG